MATQRSLSLPKQPPPLRHLSHLTMQGSTGASYTLQSYNDIDGGTQINL